MMLLRLSRFAHEPRVPADVPCWTVSVAQRTMLQYADSALVSDNTFCVDDQVAKVCCPMRKAASRC